MYHILIVEDDEKLQTVLKEALCKYGYAVTYVENFRAVEETFEKAKPIWYCLTSTFPIMIVFISAGFFAENQRRQS